MRTRLASVLQLVAVLTLVVGVLTIAHGYQAWAAEGNSAVAQTTHDQADDGDNQHPSGKDRSVEPGGSGTQGQSTSDPDDDGNGPDRSNGGADKPGGSGGEDKADQDGNNGCGNDDDFEDDNEGLCGGPEDNQSAADEATSDTERRDDNGEQRAASAPEGDGGEQTEAETIFLHNTTAEQGDAEECEDVAEGETLYHFVLTNGEATSALTVQFDQGTETVTAGGPDSDATHFYVIVPSTWTLQDAWVEAVPAENGNTLLVLSHVCEGGEAGAGVGGDEQTAAEVCDGKDNDGDGLVDEGFDVNNNGVADCEEDEGDDGQVPGGELPIGGELPAEDQGPILGEQPTGEQPSDDIGVLPGVIERPADAAPATDQEQPVAGGDEDQAAVLSDQLSAAQADEDQQSDVLAMSGLDSSALAGLALAFVAAGAGAARLGKRRGQEV